MDNVVTILRRLKNSPGKTLVLLPFYQAEEYDPLWRQDPRLFGQFTEDLISDGHPTRAFELGREGLKVHQNDPKLLYLVALALARGGNASKAAEILKKIPDPSSLDHKLRVDVLCLGPRLCKDRCESTRDPDRKAQFAQEAADGYLRAFQQTGAAYPAICAAVMAVVTGDMKSAGKLADQAIRQVYKERPHPERSEDEWALATLGAAHFIKGDLSESGLWYRKAVKAAAGHIGNIAAMRRDLFLLRGRLNVSEEIWSLLDVGNVVVFSGHMIDPPGWSGRRFPNDPILVERVSRAIQEQIEKLNATVAYCSAAWGSDILFAERMLERERCELHVILPFKREDFCKISVDFGLSGAAMSSWRARFDAVLARATEVHFATREPYLDDDVLFDFSNQFLQGLAVLRGAQRGVTPHALVVLESSSPSRVGGTAFFHKKWVKIAGKTQATVIPLENLREGSDAGVIQMPPVASKKTVAEKAHFKRQIKAMLFADMKDFSTLEESLAPLFMRRFLSEVSQAIDGLKIKTSNKELAFCNTWGDGLYIVFHDVEQAAEFALGLMERIEKVDWLQLGLKEISPLRIGMHAGPVYKGLDPIIKRQNYFGTHVTRTARIEPVTIPGTVFVSEQFAALLAVRPNHGFVCEFVGVENLAKGYDRCPLYRLARR